MPKITQVNKKLLPDFAYPIICGTVIMIVWQLFSFSESYPDFLIPAPLAIFNVITSQSQEFLTAIIETFSSICVGYFLSVMIGNLIAIIFSLVRLLKLSFLPFAIFFQTIPIVAIAPLLVIYFGFGKPTVIATSFLVSVFPIIANTLIGLDSTPKELIELFEVYKISKMKTLMYLKIPAAYSHIYAGLKISAGLSVIGAVAGEFVAGGGLGAMIDTARTQQRVDIIFAAFAFLSLIGLFFIFLVKTAHFVLHLYRPFALDLKE